MSYTDLPSEPAAASSRTIDLRSDTVTRPNAEMRSAMAAAPVGDDVYGDDPTVNALEHQVAERLGKEAALLFPSGTQSNLAGVLSHCGRGDEILVGDGYHTYRNEAAGASVLGGVAFCPLTTNPDGSIPPETVRAEVKPDDPHCPVSRLLALENTVGGQPISLDAMRAAANAARASNLAVHLDGARLFNAAVALDVPVADLAATADSVSVCLSKGLGAPVGSVLAGTSTFIARARRHRKLLGGGMRQAGVIAAAGRHALEHNVSELAADHRKAAALARELEAFPRSAPVRQATNMVYFAPPENAHAELLTYLKTRNILVGGQRPSMRIVLHRDIAETDLATVLEAFRAFFDT